MSRILRAAAVAAVAGALAAVSVLLFGLDRGDRALDAYLVFLAAVVALTVGRLAAAAFPEPRGSVPRTLARISTREVAPESLERLEDVVALAQAAELDLHFRLRPTLVRVAEAGYATRAGGQGLPPAAEGAFAPEAWELVRPDRPRPIGTGAAGIATPRLAAVLDDLERMLPP